MFLKYCKNLTEKGWSVCVCGKVVGVDDGAVEKEVGLWLLEGQEGLTPGEREAG